MNSILKRVIIMQCAVRWMLFAFAITLWSNTQVPLYIIGMPVVMTFVANAYCTILVYNYKITPRVNTLEESYKRDRDNINELLYTIARLEPRDNQQVTTAANPRELLA